MKLRVAMFSLALGAMFSSTAGAVPIPVATWEFNNTFAANEGAAPALTPIDPLGLNSFVTDTVFGDTRPVYRFDGSQLPPTSQAGLSVNTTGLLNNDNSYSVDLIFQFEANQATWEFIFGVSNRTSDNAFYVEPGNKLQIYPVGNGPTTFTFGEYHRATLTNDGAGHVTAYLDGVFQFDLITTVMDFSTYAGGNPDRLIHFFTDNVVSGGQGEFADGRVALIRLYDLELTPTEVDQLDSVPEPATLALLGIGALGLLFRRQRCSRTISRHRSVAAGIVMLFAAFSSGPASAALLFADWSSVDDAGNVAIGSLGGITVSFGLQPGQPGDIDGAVTDGTATQFADATLTAAW